MLSHMCTLSPEMLMLILSWHTKHTVEALLHALQHRKLQGSRGLSVKSRRHSTNRNTESEPEA